MYRAMIWAITAVAVLALAPVGGLSSASAAEQDTVVYGPDYKSFLLLRGGWQRCERECENDARCAAWLFVNATRHCA